MTLAHACCLPPPPVFGCFRGACQVRALVDQSKALLSQQQERAELRALANKIPYEKSSGGHGTALGSAADSEGGSSVARRRELDRHFASALQDFEGTKKDEIAHLRQQ